MANHKRVNIKAILTDPVLREELVEGATDFICKVEGIRQDPLSSAAQAVLDAAYSAYDDAATVAQGTAAALRAAADQVVPEEPLHHGDQRWQFERDARQHCRLQFHAIAAELEGVQ